MRLAGQRGDPGTIRALIAPGVTTADLNAAADEVLQEAWLLLALQGLWASAVSGLHLHQRERGTGARHSEQEAHPARRRYHLVDSGTVLNGFVADSAFTAGVGEISPEARHLLETTEGRPDGGHAADAPGQAHG